MTDKPVRLENRIMDYAWGSNSAIQELLGKQSETGSPWAELWMGAHPKAPSRIRTDDEVLDLDRAIRRDPDGMLGPAVARKFDNTLPFLFKVLAAEQPLSIQAHPDRAEAAEGFERENRANIPIDAPDRSYRDAWPKPEIICALEPFVALNGFRPPKKTIELLDRFCPVSLRPEIDAFAASPDPAGTRTLFKALLCLPEDRREKVLHETDERAHRIDSDESAWIRRLSDHYTGDIGILSPLFLNLIRLAPGQAMFLPPGRMHAYLHGVGIELMANSDNVLRGGLTGKHMDIEELMRVVRFDASPVELLAAESTGTCEKHYRIDVEEFALSVITPDRAISYTGPETHSVEILLCIKGAAKLRTPNAPAVELEKGEAVLVPAATGTYRITGAATLYKAAVPL